MMLLSNAANLFRRSFANRPTFATLADPTLKRIARRREGKTGEFGGSLGQGAGLSFFVFLRPYYSGPASAGGVRSVGLLFVEQRLPV